MFISAIVLHVNRAIIVVNYMTWLVIIRSLMTSTGWLEMKRTRQPGEPTGPSISRYGREISAEKKQDNDKQKLYN